jgi:hypothetical protein
LFLAAAGVRRLPGCGGTAASQLERRRRRDARAPERLRRGVGADRRAEVPLLDPQNYLPNVEGFYYMRLHGRNAAKWWRHEKSEDRYDYLYSADELKEFSRPPTRRSSWSGSSISTPTITSPRSRWPTPR